MSIFGKENTPNTYGNVLEVSVIKTSVKTYTEKTDS